MIYLDNASTSFPKPESVYKAMDRYMRDIGASPGRAAYRSALKAGEIVHQTRISLAKFFNFKDYKRVILNFNATDALNMVIKGIAQKGDHVITTDIEHNAVSRPLNILESQGIIELTRISSSNEGEVDPLDIKKSITKNTRMIILSHASNVLGTIQNVQEVGKIARKQGIILIVDAAQTAGLLNIDVEEMKIDILVFTGHKGLMGPPGTGGALIRDGIQIKTWREGGTGGDSESPIQPNEMPFHLEAGTPNTAGIAGLGEAIKYIQKTGVEKIKEHELKLIRIFLEKVSSNNKVHIYGPQNLSERIGLVSFNIKGHSPDEVEAILDSSYGISVRSGLHCAPYIHQSLNAFPEGSVRISVGIFNKEDDMEKIAHAVNEISES